MSFISLSPCLFNSLLSQTFFFSIFLFFTWSLSQSFFICRSLCLLHYFFKSFSISFVFFLNLSLSLSTLINLFLVFLYFLASSSFLPISLFSFSNFHFLHLFSLSVFFILPIYFFFLFIAKATHHQTCEEEEEVWVTLGGSLTLLQEISDRGEFKFFWRARTRIEEENTT